MGDEESFFTRESGLFCRALQSLGVDSKAILLLPANGQDAPGVLRANYGDLCDPNWWKSLNLDGLVLYSWAAPQYTPVAEAVRRAGVPAIIYMDTSGLVSRLGNPWAWYRYAWQPVLAKSLGPWQALFSLGKFFIDTVFLVTPRRRLRHLSCGQAVTLPTKLGVEWMKREVTLLGRPDLATKIFYSPHPQREIFSYQQGQKENLVISVARFLPEDWAQKRPSLLLRSLNSFLDQKGDWKAVVVGRGAAGLPTALGLQPHPSMELLEKLPQSKLVMLYQTAKIGFWTSLWEGQQGTAAQALCCGCSVVAPASPLNSCFTDYVCHDSGRLAKKSSAEDLAHALKLESEDWVCGLRDPEKISVHWSKLFHAKNRAWEICKLLQMRHRSIT